MLPSGPRLQTNHKNKLHFNTQTSLADLLCSTQLPSVAGKGCTSKAII